MKKVKEEVYQWPVVQNTNVGIEEAESKIWYNQNTKRATFDVFFDYFNYKMTNDAEGKEDGVKIIYFLEENEFEDGISIPAPNIVDYVFIFVIGGVDYNLRCNSIINDSKLYHTITLHSKQVTKHSGSYIYDNLFKIALGKSKLKGSYFTMPSGSYEWDFANLPNLSYDNIFLPERLMNDAKLYVKLYEEKGILGRYMFSGIPGTGKTELTRVMSSVLSKQGVTIIKTSVCEKLKEKFELAEALAPSLIIMDDIDLSLGDRNQGAYSKLLEQFLDALDGVNKLSKGVGVIATTNAPHLIDIAAQRPGRFNKILFFDDITRENILGIINKGLDSIEKQFGGVTKTTRKFFCDEKLVEFFIKNGCTGSYIYETVISTTNMMDVTDTKLTIDELITELKFSVETLDKKLATTKIKGSFDKKEGTMGYGRG